MNYPLKAYSPLTHDLYACVRSSHSGKSNAGDSDAGARRARTLPASTRRDHRSADLHRAFEAINMTNNTFAWQYGSKASTFGSCNTGAITTAGNLVFTAFAGRTDLTAAQLFAQGIAPGGVFVAFDATTGKVSGSGERRARASRAPAITYTYKGKQYIAIYHTMPAATALPGGAGHLASDQREQMTVFSL